MSIELRPLVEEDYRGLYRVIDSQRGYLGKWLPFVSATVSEYFTKAFVRTDIMNPLSRTFTILENGCPKGLAGLNWIDRDNEKAEIGYWIAQELQGRGIVTGAVRKLIQLGFGELNLNRIQIKVAVENAKSRAIPERLGFTMEGTERCGEKLDQGYVDLVIYSMLKSEYAK